MMAQVGTMNMKGSGCQKTKVSCKSTSRLQDVRHEVARVDSSLFTRPALD
jgi:hypothetical protein